MDLPSFHPRLLSRLRIGTGFTTVLGGSLPADSFVPPAASRLYPRLLVATTSLCRAGSPALPSGTRPLASMPRYHALPCARQRSISLRVAWRPDYPIYGRIGPRVPDGRPSKAANPPFRRVGGLPKGSITITGYMYSIKRRCKQAPETGYQARGPRDMMQPHAKRTRAREGSWTDKTAHESAACELTDPDHNCDGRFVQPSFVPASCVATGGLPHAGGPHRRM